MINNIVYMEKSHDERSMLYYKTLLEITVNVKLQTIGQDVMSCR